MTSEGECAFCDIVRAVAESHTVFEDERSLAFLDRRPLFPGHTLLIPRQHHETLSDLPAELIEPLFANAQLLARSMEEGLGAEGSFVAINNRVSQSVPHLHLHVVPRRRKDGLRGFFWPRTAYDDASHMREVQRRLSETVERLRAGSGA